MEFSGSYFQDHQLVYNALIDQRTSWRGKNVAAFYLLSDSVTKRYELQPLPDYMRWTKTGELHYLHFEETISIYSGPWMNIPDTFLPTEVLDQCFNVMHHPSEDILKQISLLAWIPLWDVQQYQTKLEEQLKSQVKLEQQRLQWRQAPIIISRQHKKDTWSYVSSRRVSSNSNHFKTPAMFSDTSKKRTKWAIISAGATVFWTDFLITKVTI